MHYDHYRFTTTQMKHVAQGSRKIVLEGYSSRDTNSAMGSRVCVMNESLDGTVTFRVGLVLGQVALVISWSLSALMFDYRWEC